MSSALLDAVFNQLKKYYFLQVINVMNYIYFLMLTYFCIPRINHTES